MNRFQSRERDSISWKILGSEGIKTSLMFQSRERDSISWKHSDAPIQGIAIKVSVPRTGFY